MMDAANGHYVYLYRDNQQRTRYVGYGHRPNRATAHQVASHNPRLSDFILHHWFTVEVAGPFGSEAVGRTVEAALISALNPDLNDVQGIAAGRFRPLGVPVRFADRLIESPLRREDFLLRQGESPAPVLFVTVGAVDFGDGRAGYDIANPPNDEQVLERVEKWWQLQKYLDDWTAAPGDSPALLVGVHGSPGRQMVVASLRIDRSAWQSAQPFERGEGKIRVPLLPTPGLDAFHLRGRRVAKEAGLAFEGITAGFYIILQRDGSTLGGRRLRRAG